MGKKKKDNEPNIKAFEFDGAWHADVMDAKGNVLHTTEAFEDKQTAVWVAQDWTKNPGKKA